MTRRWASLLVAVIVATVAVPSTTFADATRKGEEIAREVDRRARGFKDYRAELEMVLGDRRGQKTNRTLSVATLEDSGGVEKSLVVFSSPRDVRGTALLTYSHRGKDDEQWLYLPALRRAKRIAAGNRSSPFMGSEFAYEDLSATHVSDFGYRYVTEEKLRSTDCFVIDRTPKYSGSGYQKQRVWIDKSEYRILQVKYWDRKGRLAKTLALGGYRKYEGKFWQPGLARMVNHRTRAQTDLVWSNYRFSTGLRSSDFDQSALRRAR